MPHPTVREVADFLQSLAPLRLAEEWDNVGLLVGDAGRPVRRLMTCLTITPATSAEAVREQADMVIPHHPLPFAALKRLTTETVPGRLLIELVEGRVAVCSAHTAFDSAAEGINQNLAARIGLQGIAALAPHAEGEGTGRIGRLEPATTLGDLARRTQVALGVGGLLMVGAMDLRIHTVAVGCGAAGELIPIAHRAGCDAMVLGEARFHTCLEAESLGMGLVLPGHFASERFGMEILANRLAERFPECVVWASRDERDPLRWLGA